ncbi:TPA: Lrp/AsnC family transcriptional regulator [Candidatus Woesearchaeota archaeon]|nr:Lrp/AsnC family transcriptional regulator [Candidatus Woesearchaeota archaeon]HII68789.1 Lrp/AsnC family transcriptional regulator [Candidatus Woesearchaeota archaeon]
MTKSQQFRIDESQTRRARPDLRDEKILSLLSANARMPITAIAKKVRLSKEGTFYRMKRLLEQGVILSYYAAFDLRDFGFYTFHVFFVIDESDAARTDEFIRHLIAHRSTRIVMEYSDRWDLEWVLVARDVQDFDAIVTAVTKEFSDIVIEKQKFEIIFGYKSRSFPDSYAQGPTILGPKSPGLHEVDKINLHIMKELAEDARKTPVQMAKSVSLSPDAVRYRLRNLEKAKVIRQFSILPNLTLLGYHWETMCITVKTFDLSHEMKFREYISDKPSVIRAVKVLGNWDLMLHIATKDASELHKAVKGIHKAFVDIIVGYQTWGAYREHYFTSLPKIIVENKDEAKRRGL